MNPDEPHAKEPMGNLPGGCLRKRDPPACRGTRLLRPHAPGAAPATGDYSSPDANLVVSESVEVQATERDARLVMAQITNPEVPDCVAAAYAELGGAALSTGAITEGAEIGEVTASRLAVGSAGDATQAIRVVIPVISGETTAQLTVDQVFTRAGRSFTTITFEGRVEATPVETIDEITAVAASSLPA